jgi:DNA-binding transcriptional ArsR family regulator
MERDLLTALKALVDADRMRLLGRLADRPQTLDELASALRLPKAALTRHLDLLESAGLIARPDDAVATGYVIRKERFVELGRALAALDADTVTRPLPGDPRLDGLTPADAQVVRGYLVGDRLVAIPSSAGKLLPVLRWLRDRVFVEDRAYPEKEVNQRLALYHEDVASLRRYMVDAGLVSREGGLYRRVNGPPDVRPSRSP